MNGVIGMTGLLLDTALTPEQRDYAETVRRSGEALLTVINDILDFSKVEAGRMAIEAMNFDLRMIVEEVNEMLAPRAEEKRLELILHYPPEAPRFFIGDAGRIRQVVTNLVGNALKFTDQGQVVTAVTCQVAEAVPGIALMKVTVTDTGTGIEPDKLGSLFEKFSQVDGSATRKYGGTGLGLAISKQLIVLMGGTVGVESRPGVGSIFWFTLPLKIDSEQSANPVAIGTFGTCECSLWTTTKSIGGPCTNRSPVGACGMEATGAPRKPSRPCAQPRKTVTPTTSCCWTIRCPAWTA